jgi:molecular chaperone GrpE
MTQEENTPASEEMPAAPDAILSKEEQLEKELQEHKDKYLRLLAESENTRKRLQKEKQDMMRFAVENIVSEFLTPMDNLENALHFAEQASEETANWARGFHMILEQFKDVLSGQGISSFASVGKHFDPHCHEAVETEFSETAQDGLILQEYVKGYKSKERIIRPARVKVAKKSIHSAADLDLEEEQKNKE